MHVEQLMARQVESCRPQDTLERAAQLMWNRDCGCLPVCAADGSAKAVAMITDRDIAMCALFQAKPLRELRVALAMSRQLRVCGPGDELAQAESAMRAARIRRLPVVDEQGELIGLISLADLAEEAARERSNERRQITDAEVGDTLAAVCEPAGRSVAA